LTFFFCPDDSLALRSTGGECASLTGFPSLS
jgi:hypothetical protein